MEQIEQIIQGLEGSRYTEPAVEVEIEGQIRLQQPSAYRVCSHCLIKKGSSNGPSLRYLTHCSICGICVEDLDHHCVFYGKCIARDNIQYFNCSVGLFIVSVIYFVVLMFFDGINAGSHKIHRLQQMQAL